MTKPKNRTRDSRIKANTVEQGYGSCPHKKECKSFPWKCGTCEHNQEKKDYYRPRQPYPSPHPYSPGDYWRPDWVHRYPHDEIVY